MADDGFTAHLADVADKAAGEAFRAGDHDRALMLINEARDLDKSRAELWDQREARVKQDETKRTPLPELMDRRLARLDLGKEDPAITQWAEWNRQLGMEAEL